MNPFQQFLVALANAIVPVLVSWFQKHVLPQNQGLQALPPQELRAAAHAWVLQGLTELGQSLVTMGVIPAWLQGFLPPLEGALSDAISKALDAAGL